MKLERLLIDGEEYFLEIKDKSNTRNHSWYWECGGRSGSMPWLSQCYCWDRATKEAIIQFRLLLDMHKKEINRKEVLTAYENPTKSEEIG